MARGPKYKKSENPTGERVITWRHKGKLHDALMEEVTRLGVSANYFITKAVEEKLANQRKPKD